MSHEVTCPACEAAIIGGADADITLDADPRPPQHGDIVVCPVCAQVSIIVDTTLVLLTPARVQTLKPDVRAVILHAQRVVRSEVN